MSNCELRYVRIVMLFSICMVHDFESVNNNLETVASYLSFLPKSPRIHFKHVTVDFLDI